MDKPLFVYVTYISAAPEKIWKALVEPETTTKFWQHVNISDWKPGSRWEHRRDGPQGEALIQGRVLECEPPKRLVMTWAPPEDERDGAAAQAGSEAEARAGGYSRVSIDLAPVGGVTKLTVTHDWLESGSEMLSSISEGWPKVLSSLKSLMETGSSLPRQW
jgi:uncharacterized protein YndB with AHSA1/START domain